MRAKWVLGLGLALGLACGGGEEAAEPIGQAPVFVPEQPPPEPIVAVPTGDPIVDTYLADCYALLPPEDPSLGDDECRVAREPGEAEDAYGCVERARSCGTDCGTRCGICQTQCADTCDSCKRAAEDAASLTWCAEQRAACRLVCTRAQSECARTCVEDIPRCREVAAAQREADCPRCEQIALCLEDRGRVKICRDKYPDEKEECFTWCAKR